MLNKVALASVAALGLMTPLAYTPKAEAGDFKVEIRSGYGHPDHQDRDRRYFEGAVPEEIACGTALIPGPVLVMPHYRDYCVMYRGCAAEPWREYGVFPGWEVAHRAEERLERRGYEAYVVRH